MFGIFWKTLKSGHIALHALLSLAHVISLNYNVSRMVKMILHFWCLYLKEYLEKDLYQKRIVRFYLKNGLILALCMKKWVGDFSVPIKNRKNGAVVWLSW